MKLCRRPCIKKKGAPGELNLKELPKPKEIKEFLDQYIIGQDDAKTLSFRCRVQSLQASAPKRWIRMISRLKSPISLW